MPSARRYPRIVRVNEVVLETLADGLGRLEDPRLELVTLTGAKVSPDLREATIYYSARVAKASPAEVDAALHHAAPRLRTSLGRQVRLKYLPRLQFREDPSIRSGERIDAIIQDLHKEAESSDD
jgi:ribosome-binding factor A